MKNIRQTVLAILPWLIVGAIGLFFYRTLAGNLEQLKGMHFGIDLWAIAGTLLFVAAVVVSGMLWGSLLQVLSGARITTRDAIRIHAASWLLKYVPGQVGSYVNKVAWGTQQGISKKTTSTSFIYENVLMVIAGVVLSVPAFMLFADQFADNLTLFVPIFMAVPLLLVMYKPAFYWLLNRMTALLKKKPFKASDFLASNQLVRYQLGYLLPRLLNGIGFVLIAASLVEVAPSMYVGLGATYILASIVGLLAVFVPGGLGVREAVIVAFVSVYMPVEQAIIISLVARLYATVADLGVGGIYLLLSNGRIRQS